MSDRPRPTIVVEAKGGVINDVYTDVADAQVVVLDWDNINEPGYEPALFQHFALDDMSERSRQQVVKEIAGPPQPTGIWVAMVSGPDLVHYGIDGGTERPFPPDQREEALKQAHYLAKKNYTAIYLLNLFSNGQMRVDEFDENDYEKAQRKKA